MKLVKFFDELEDRIRFSLSGRPILYALISGLGVVLFFRGVWLVSDSLPFMTGWVTLAAGLLIMLLTGSFVFHFVGDALLKQSAGRQKKLSEKVAAARRRKKSRKAK